MTAQQVAQRISAMKRHIQARVRARQFREMYEMGLSREEISEFYGCRPNKVTTDMRKYEPDYIPRRTGGPDLPNNSEIVPPDFSTATLKSWVASQLTTNGESAMRHWREVTS